MLVFKKNHYRVISFMQKKYMLYIAALTLLCSCATRYKEEGTPTAGYYQTQYSSNEFEIVFKSGYMTSREDVMKYALLKASELCIEHGFSYFKVEKKQNLAVTAHIHTREEVLPGVKFTIKCYKKDPKLLAVVNAHDFLKYNTIGLNADPTAPDKLYVE